MDYELQTSRKKSFKSGESGRGHRIGERQGLWEPGGFQDWHKRSKFTVRSVPLDTKLMMVARLSAGISRAPTNAGGEGRLSEENVPRPNSQLPEGAFPTPFLLS